MDANPGRVLPHYIWREGGHAWEGKGHCNEGVWGSLVRGSIKKSRAAAPFEVFTLGGSQHTRPTTKVGPQLKTEDSGLSDHDWHWFFVCKES